MTRTISVRLWRDAILIHFLFLRLKHTRPGERYRTLQIFQSVRVNSEITCQPSVFRAVNSPLIPKPPKPKVFVYLLFCFFFGAYTEKSIFVSSKCGFVIMCRPRGSAHESATSFQLRRNGKNRFFSPSFLVCTTETHYNFGFLICIK